MQLRQDETPDVAPGLRHRHRSQVRCGGDLRTTYVFRKVPTVQKALLSELQSFRSYPSITVLFNTTTGGALSQPNVATALRLIDDADRRLREEVSDNIRSSLITTITGLLHLQLNEPTTKAMALFVSSETQAVVRLGQPVTDRVIIDETFATRDLVADLNRTALYRVVTISDRSARLFVGDRQRLAEDRSEGWPLMRPDEMTSSSWTVALGKALQAEQERHPLATVFAGVDRSIRKTLVGQLFESVGVIPGNHDRTSWAELHTLSWPLVTDWLRADGKRAFAELENARSQRLFASGIHELWVLGDEGRISLLAVEESYAVAATLTGTAVNRVADPTAPGVVDDLVDELIEVVLSKGGSVVMVPDDSLADNDRIAGVLRY